MKFEDILNYIAETAINEDLGTLMVLDPMFRKMFGSRYHKSNKAINNLAVGQESPVESVETAKPSEAAALLFSENSPILGMVLVVDEKQILSIAKFADEFNIILDAKTYSKDIEMDKARLNKVVKLMYGYDAGRFSRDVEDVSVTLAKAKAILNSVFKAAKEDGANSITALTIKADVSRLEKQKERKKARTGSEAVAAKSDRFERDAKNALRSRLDKFKASKAEQYETPQEFMAAALQAGFMDKVSIGGFVYKIDSDQLRLRDIIKPSTWNSSNRIVYIIDSSYNEKLRNLSHELYQLSKTTTDNDETSKEKYNTLMSKFPPRKISVIMGMQGGSIVPIDVEVSTDQQTYVY